MDLAEGSSVGTALCKARAAALELSLNRIVVKHSQIAVLDESINRYHQLTHLELTNNRLKAISVNVNLPKLMTLNVSGNNLMSLHGLQLLTSLENLNVSHNKLINFGSSINLLVPLASKITTFDASFNEVNSISIEAIII